MEVAEHERAVFAAEMHAIAFAITEHLAVVAGLNLFHPIAVAILLETRTNRSHSNYGRLRPEESLT